MAVGAATWFDRAVRRGFDVGPFDLNGTDLYMILTTAAQALTRSFTGGSGDCRYADFTAELATAFGYTNGGLAFTAPAINVVGTDQFFDSDPLTWALSATISARYAVCIDKLSANDNALFFFDLNTSLGAGVNASIGPPTLILTPDPDGWLKWYQP